MSDSSDSNSKTCRARTLHCLSPADFSSQLINQPEVLRTFTEFTEPLSNARSSNNLLHPSAQLGELTATTTSLPLGGVYQVPDINNSTARCMAAVAAGAGPMLVRLISRASFAEKTGILREFIKSESKTSSDNRKSPVLFGSKNDMPEVTTDQLIHPR
ncbi:unnamed protein product, partial [Protopolystoma xenopodis]